MTLKIFKNKTKDGKSASRRILREKDRIADVVGKNDSVSIVSTGNNQYAPRRTHTFSKTGVVLLLVTM